MAATRVYVLVAPPGSGKGTQGTLLARRLGLPHISAGDELRASLYGGRLSQPEGAMGKGHLLADSEVWCIVRARLEEPDCSRGFILDGFPRTLRQVCLFDEWIERGVQGTADVAVIHLHLEKDEVRKRNDGRRFCPSCGRDYNVHYYPPRTPGICDECGMCLARRADCVPDVLERRLAAYQDSTSVVIDTYSQRGQLIWIDAVGSKEEVHGSIVDAIGV